MTRLILWVNGFLLHFALAYYLKQKTDLDCCAVIDIPSNPKKFFEKQKLVNFKQQWFLHDHIKKNQDPDIEYLKNAESKYSLDLWKLMLNERYFFKFNRFYKFKKNEMLSIIEQEIRLYETILNEAKPDCFLTIDPPLQQQQLLMDMCKARKIQVLCLYMGRFGDQTIIAEDESLNLEDEKFNIARQEKQENDYSIKSIEYTKKKIPSIASKAKALLDFVMIPNSDDQKNNFMYYGRSKPKVILDAIEMMRKKSVRTKYMNDRFTKTPDLSKKFVYFAMNVDEELSMLHYSPYNTNQVETILNVAKSIPVDHLLYVKEHPMEVFRSWKKITEYEKIRSIPDVVMVNPSVKSEDLIKAASLVVTIRGTASFDAALFGKPSLVFGSVSYTQIPSIFQVGSMRDLPSLISKAMKTQVQKEAVDSYLDKIKNRSINFEIMSYELRRNMAFFSGNILSNREISNETMKKFLDSEKDKFEPLVSAHIQILNKMFKS